MCCLLHLSRSRSFSLRPSSRRRSFSLSFVLKAECESLRSRVEPLCALFNVCDVTSELLILCLSLLRSLLRSATECDGRDDDDVMCVESRSGLELGVLLLACDCGLLG